MNEISSSSSLSLSRLQQIVENRIQETRNRMIKSYLREDTDRLWIQVETLEWALYYIVRLLREQQKKQKQ